VRLLLAPSVPLLPDRGKATPPCCWSTRTTPAASFPALDVPQVAAQRDHGAVAVWRAEQQAARHRQRGPNLYAAGMQARLTLGS